MPTLAPADVTLIRDLADTAAALVGEIIPDCEGACLGTSAILAYVLGSRGIPTTAVRGEYDEHPHWWLETSTHRIDATRAQFLDGMPLVEALNAWTEESPYEVGQVFPARWSREQAVEEFTRMFEFVDVGEAHGWRVLTALEQHH